MASLSLQIAAAALSETPYRSQVWAKVAKEIFYGGVATLDEGVGTGTLHCCFSMRGFFAEFSTWLSYYGCSCFLIKASSVSIRRFNRFWRILVVLTSTPAINIFRVVLWSIKNACSHFGIFLSFGQVHWTIFLHLHEDISNKTLLCVTNSCFFSSVSRVTDLKTFLHLRLVGTLWSFVSLLYGTQSVMRLLPICFQYPVIWFPQHRKT